MSHQTASNESSSAPYQELFSPLDQHATTHLSPNFDNRSFSRESDSTLYDAGAYASSNDASDATSIKRPIAQTVRKVSDVTDASSGLLVEKEKAADQHNAPLPRRPWYFVADWWLAEIVAALFSLGCMLAVAILLFKFENKPLSSWEFPIAMNSLLSVLLTLAKTSLLLVVAESMTQLKWNHFARRARPLRDFQVFDDASKGPWGALQLLWHTRGSALLASMGASVIVLSLAMDPFAQQILAFPPRSVAATTNGTLPIANHYGALANNTPTDIDFGVQRAVYGGLFSDQTTPPGTCGTGNCTFEPFSTLGVCSQCEDISTETNITCTMKYINTTTPVWFCDYHSPSGSVFSGCTLHYGGAAPESCFNYKQNLGHTKWTSIANIYPNLTTLVNFAAINIKNRYDIMPGKKMKKGTITECSLNWCAKTYPNWNISDSKVVNSRVIVSPLAPSPPNNTLTRVNINTANYTTTRPIGNNMTTNLTFGIGGREQSNLKTFLANIFTTSLSSNNASANWPPPLDPTEQITMASALFQANGGHMIQTVSALANSLDAQVRQSGNQIFKGIAWKSETYIKVKWLWLLLPTLLVMLGILFLFASLLRTWMTHRTYTAPHWKSSTLAPLFHGLEGIDDPSGLQSRVSMENVARSMQVQLRFDEKGEMRFVRSGS